MSVTLSIKNVPDHISQALRERAARHHRSIQGELMAILEASLHQENRLTAQELLEQVRGSGLRTADDAVAMIRADREAR
ncbi:MAG: FitA-like ribbon-helix-helix domain-containing protein [Gammaproteobacteria bacterium]